MSILLELPFLIETSRTLRYVELELISQRESQYESGVKFKCEQAV